MVFGCTATLKNLDVSQEIILVANNSPIIAPYREY